MDETDCHDRARAGRASTTALARGIELVVTPLLFGLGGWFLDRWLGTWPLFTLILFVVAVVGWPSACTSATPRAWTSTRAGVWARRQASAVESGGGDGRG